MSEQPDVVIYSIHEALQPIVAIEVCSEETFYESKLMAKRIVEKELVFEYTNTQWHRITSSGEMQISFSDILQSDFKHIV